MKFLSFIVLVFNLGMIKAKASDNYRGFLEIRNENILNKISITSQKFFKMSAKEYLTPTSSSQIQQLFIPEQLTITNNEISIISNYSAFKNRTKSVDRIALKLSGNIVETIKENILDQSRVSSLEVYTPEVGSRIFLTCEWSKSQL